MSQNQFLYRLLCLSPSSTVDALPVDLVKWSCIIKAALPHLVDHLGRLFLVLTARPLLYRQSRPSPHALLQLLRDAPLSPGEELPTKPALTRQRRSTNLHTISIPTPSHYTELTDLSASCMPQIVRVIILEPQIIPRVHHLMRHRILHMPSIPKLIRTDQYPIFRVKAAALLGRAPPAVYVLLVDVLAQLVDVLPHESHDGAVLQKPGFLLLAARAVRGFVDIVAVPEVGVGGLFRGVAGQDGEEGRPVVEVFVWDGFVVWWGCRSGRCADGGARRVA